MTGERIIHQLQQGRKVLTARRELISIGVPPVQTCVTGDEIADWYWSGDKLYWDMREDFGSIRPPFDQMWIEWTLPPDGRYVTADGSQRPKDVVAQGAFIAYADRSFTVQTVVHLRGVGLHIPAWYEIIDLDDTERFKRHRIAVDTKVIGAPTAEWLKDKLAPHEVLLTLSMMNCRNARAASEPLGKATRRALAKNGAIPISMTTIRLPAARSRSKADVKAAQGGSAPLHLVRGHFKTYTADAPLFGSKTGTWWWGWQARGDADHGVRGHQYEVGVS